MEPALTLDNTKPGELSFIFETEQGDAAEFIIPYSIERHKSEFGKPEVIYKSIRLEGEWIGFIILVLDPDGFSAEFRRIVVNRPGHGYGTMVLGMTDQICREELGLSRIWLDVFETNLRARNVYERAGYQLFDKSEYEGRTLLLYEKMI